MENRLVIHDKKLCVKYTDTHFGEPKVTSVWWPIGQSKPNLLRITKAIEDCVGNELCSYRSDDPFVDILGGWNHYLVDGGRTKPIYSETFDVLKPKTKRETRWNNGKWEKLFKTGWR